MTIRIDLKIQNTNCWFLTNVLTALLKGLILYLLKHILIIHRRVLISTIISKVPSENFQTALKVTAFYFQDGCGTSLVCFEYLVPTPSLSPLTYVGNVPILKNACGNDAKVQAGYGG